MTTSVPSCAVVLKASGWDPFLERQSLRLRAAAGGMDLYLSLDETGGRVGAVDMDQVVRFTGSELAAGGLALRSPVGSPLWWNSDYAHYHFLQQCPHYDYYLFVEYDCVVQASLETFVTRAAAQRADLVAYPMSSPFDRWHWTPYQRNVYPRKDIGRSLLCFSLYSARALTLLYGRRLAMSSDPNIKEWPSAELFVPTEIKLANMKWLPLGEFGDVSRYKWFPPSLEDDLTESSGNVFLHPVLDRPRYLSCVLENRGSLSSAELQATLGRFERTEYAHLIWQSARKSAVTAMRHKIRRKLSERKIHSRSPLKHTIPYFSEPKTS
jgi:hypothetical protein